MVKRFLGYVTIIALVFSVGCATAEKQVSKETMAATGEKLIWASENPRPGWTIKEPEFEGAFLHFVGISGDIATEQLSRDDAMNNATKNVIRYLGTLAKDKFEKMSTSFGLAGDVANPTEVRNNYEKQVAAAAAKNLKAANWYLEKWEKPTGVGWKAFVLAKIPKDALDESFKKTMDNQIQEAQKKQKEANDDVAKKQLDKSIEMMKKMKESGIAE